MGNLTAGLINTMTNMTTLADPFILINNITGGAFGLILSILIFALIIILSEDRLNGIVIAGFVGFIVASLLNYIGILNSGVALIYLVIGFIALAWAVK